MNDLEITKGGEMKVLDCMMIVFNISLYYIDDCLYAPDQFKLLFLFFLFINNYSIIFHGTQSLCWFARVCLTYTHLPQKLVFFFFSSNIVYSILRSFRLLSPLDTPHP